MVAMTVSMCTVNGYTSFYPSLTQLLHQSAMLPGLMPASFMIPTRL